MGCKINTWDDRSGFAGRPVSIIGRNGPGQQDAAALQCRGGIIDRHQTAGGGERLSLVGSHGMIEVSDFGNKDSPKRTT
ncbi:protein of unknown function [Bradyrhizobium vignae]|uniref:Uncharacterized protein n=1 Tax=Bradyrhizobium vignae TaxID=1549949 RepID=A0A2U3PSM6_9BRAD|nr:protein of unknown function [Bradyrhizobium vignae]